jgi:hypothetical protein
VNFLGIGRKEWMAEREGFEPPIPVKVCLISSQVHSTGLCHLSVVNLGLQSPALVSLVVNKLQLQRATKDGGRQAAEALVRARIPADYGCLLGECTAARASEKLQSQFPVCI